jgi:hypothetical protein
MPEGQDFDAARFCVYLVVEVVPGSAQKETANALLLGVASTRSDPRLGGDKFKGSLKVLDEGKRGCGTIAPPPRRRPPDLCRGAQRRLEGEACDQGLLAKFPEEGLRINELPPGRLLERLFEGSLLIGRQLEALVRLGNKDRNSGSFF